MASEDTKSCKGCGATIYPEHIESGIAKQINGRLLCPHCVKEKQQAVADATDILEPISFESDDNASTKIDMSGTRIMTTEDTLGKGGAHDESQYKRPVDPRSSGACRCRTFHSKLSQGAIDFMDKQINDWLDRNHNIEIKFSTATIGMFEGKHTEPNLIMTLFY